MGKIIKVSGPLVVADGMADANMADVVRVGPQQLIGEILNMTGDRASIQVYEETSGLGPGADVVTTGAPLSVELGPGLIENIYDGIQRPLEEIVRRVGSNITRGIQVPPLDRRCGRHRGCGRHSGHRAGDGVRAAQDHGAQGRRGHGGVAGRGRTVQHHPAHRPGEAGQR